LSLVRLPFRHSGLIDGTRNLSAGTPRRKSKYVTFKDREQIAMAFNRNLRLPESQRLSIRELATQIGLPYGTLHREIQRGLVRQPALHKDKEYWEYSEHIAQDNIRAGAQNKGRGMRFTNVLAALLAIKVKDERKSPAHARKELVAEGMPFVPAVSTIYAHIDHGRHRHPPRRNPLPPQAARETARPRPAGPPKTRKPVHR
jgi:IS30 family transposase